jgi:2-polyprenyl-6-methoxyphenol hydroxylase-like FAD-dependent oxidoreductase
MRAVVMGGGIAGLAAAAALAPRAEVTIVERDVMDRVSDGRKGVPQAAHQHLLLRRGLLALEALLPGVSGDLRDAGAVPFDAGADVAWLTPSGWAPRVPSGIRVLGTTRAVLEAVLRRRVESLPSVRIVTGLQWAGITSTGGSGAVDGVMLSEGRAGPHSAVRAELVVDATGRGSRAPAFLRAAGLPVPAETVTESRLAYASLMLRDADLPDGLVGAYVRSAPPRVPRGGVILPVEDDRHLVTLIGPSGDPPPSDLEGAIDYAEGLRSPLIASVLRRAHACGPVMTSRSTANRWRHHERLGGRPASILTVGDALCALNPAYQQGMTLAAIAAETLADVLRETTDPELVCHWTHRRLAPVLREAWLVATHEQRPAPHVASVTRFRGRHLRAVGRAGAVSPTVRAAQLEVLHMIARPRRLLRPGVLLHLAAASVAPSRPASGGIPLPWPPPLTRPIPGP